MSIIKDSDCDMHGRTCDIVTMYAVCEYVCGFYFHFFFFFKLSITHLISIPIWDSIKWQEYGKYCLTKCFAYQADLEKMRAENRMELSWKEQERKTTNFPHHHICVSLQKWMFLSYFLPHQHTKIRIHGDGMLSAKIRISKMNFCQIETII